MKLMDQVISTLEMFVERQHEEVLDCIPDPNQGSYSNAWKTALGAQAAIYDTYRGALESVRRSRSIQNVPRHILDAVFEHIDAMEEE